MNPNDVRQKMGIVFQAFNLFPHMNVLENIILAPDEGTWSRSRPRD